MLIDTSRNGWGGPNRPTALNSSPTTVDSYVAANKVDQRPFRGDWCNQAGAGIGARPTVLPYGASQPHHRLRVDQAARASPTVTT